MTIKEYLYDNRGLIKSSLAALVQIPSVSGQAEGNYPYGKPCAEVMDEFMRICAENGFSPKNFDYYAGAVDLYDGKYGDAKLGILAHLDVVKADASAWNFPCHTLTEKTENGRTRWYGRGTQDDKGPLIAALFAMKAVRDLGFKLNANVRLIAGCAEEVGGDDIEQYLKRSYMPENVFTPDAGFPLINGEKGRLLFTFGLEGIDLGTVEEIYGGEITNAVPDTAFAIIRGEIDEPLPDGFSKSRENGAAKITVKGKASHASAPQAGENAITKLLEKLKKMNVLGTKAAALDKISELFPHNEYDARSLGLGNTDTSCALTKIRYKNGVLKCCCDMRFGVKLNEKDCSEKIRSSIEEKGFSFTKEFGSEPHITDENSPFVKALLSSYEKVTGKKGCAKTIGGGTYVHGIKNGVAFGMEFEGEDYHIHGADEFVYEDELLLAAEIYAQAIIACG